MGRSIENIANSFVPLTDNPDILKTLDELQAAANVAVGAATKMYNLIAREALRG